MKNPKVVAIVCADIHLKHKPPICRWGEGDDWYAAMARPLQQLRRFAETYKAPILYAGDIFDTWNPPPELINFAIKNLPPGLAIPGQHDLPYHNYEDIERSAYWTLVEADILYDLKPYHTHDYYHEDLDLEVKVTAFPWGYPVNGRYSKRTRNKIEIALAHKFVWQGETPFPGAPPDQKANQLQKDLFNYDIAVFGDNHKQFSRERGKPIIYNCGSLMRNTADQINYQPGIGLIYSDKVIGWEELNISQDKFLVNNQDWIKNAEIPELQELAEAFSQISRQSISFIERLNDLLKTNDLADDVKKIIVQAIEVSKNADR